jgi:DNA polymerase III subunit delta
VPSIKPDQLESSIRAGSLGSIYLFDGPENWLKEQAVNRIINRLLSRESRDFNLDRLDGKTCSAAQVVSSLQSLPWMTDRRVVVIQSCEEFSSSDGKIISQELRGVPDSTCVLFTYEGKSNLREEIPAHVASLGQVVTFWPPFPNQLPLWVQSEARQRGKIITHEAALLLSEACTDLQHIVNELDKIFLFVGNKKTVELSDIYKHGLPEEFGDCKDLEEALWNRNTKEALRQGRLLSDSGFRPESLFPVLERLFKALLLGHFMLHHKNTPLEDLPSALNVRGKTNQDKFRRGLKAYTPQETRASLKKIIQAELDLKTGALPSAIVVSLLIWNLCKKEGRDLVL